MCIKRSLGWLLEVGILGGNRLPLVCLKLNFDGALFEKQACEGLGVVIRDSTGLNIGVLS